MKILILGAGSIGSNLTVNLAVDLKGKHEITVLDFDSVEDRNVTPGTQFYFKDQVGLLKTEALQYNISRFHNRDIAILTGKVEERIKSVADLYSYHLIIDCFDTHKAREYIKTKAVLSSKFIHLLHIGFSDKLTFAIEWDENYTVPTDSTSGVDICEQEGASSFVKLVTSLSSLVIQNYITKGGQKEFVGNNFSIREVI